MSKTINKPITVARQEFISSLSDLVNYSHLPAFVIEAILKDFYLDVRAVSKQQLEQDTKAYHAALKAEKRDESELPVEAGV